MVDIEWYHMFKFAFNYRADTETEGERKLTGSDKAVLGFLWSMATIYGMMSEQVLSKEVNRPCSVRERLNSPLSIAALMFGFIIPIIFGPITIIIINFALNCVGSVCDVDPAQVPKKEDIPGSCCMITLTSICITIYSVSLIITEIIPEIYNVPFNLIMLKYVFGTFHHFLCPLSFLVIRNDLWELCKIVYRKGGSNQNRSVDMTYEEMQKQLGLGVDVN